MWSDIYSEMMECKNLCIVLTVRVGEAEYCKWWNYEETEPPGVDLLAAISSSCRSKPFPCEPVQRIPLPKLPPSLSAFKDSTWSSSKFLTERKWKLHTVTTTVNMAVGEDIGGFCFLKAEGRLLLSRCENKKKIKGNWDYCVSQAWKQSWGIL